MSSPAQVVLSVSSFVSREEQVIFAEFESGYLTELSPASPLEHTLAREIVQASWRLRRCASLESAPPDNMTDEELDRLQTSIDRARAAAQRTFHRSLKELRRIQSERVMNSAKQTQSGPEQTVAIARSAPCPCKSGEKYKRCCGKTAPPLLC